MYNSLAETQAAIAAGTTTTAAITESYLQRIMEYAHLNAFVEVFEQEAQLRASAVDEKWKAGKQGKLAGLVIAIKDNICIKGHKVSAASNILKGFESLYNATVIERLLAQDAIIIGRTNCDEFAMGSSNENSAYGLTRLHLDAERVPGGSSGGSAVAVAAKLCLASLGTDTGGSIRQPASFCGVVGFKPSYGCVSRYGAIAYASSFDQIGPFAYSVDDCRRIMEVIAGPDEFDSTMFGEQIDFTAKPTHAKKRIAYFREYLESPGLDPEIRQYVESLFEQLRRNGHEVTVMDFPYLNYVIPTYYVLTTAEASSNLSRYDGVHYGYRSPNAKDLESTYKLSRTEGFGKEVKRRIMLGTFVLSSGYYDAYYSKAQKVRQLIRKSTLDLFQSFDFIILPTTPGTSFKIGENSADPIKMYLEDIYTVQANLCGIPSISLPLGKHSNGLPFGVQVMAAPMKDQLLLDFSEELVQNQLVTVL
jgi:aspartyl-tRNA(Asn)/glutamyl-tRNA(Gln) amidotransferase subunit A